MPGRYAIGTNVNPDRTQGEIQRTLRRFGITGFGIFERTNVASVAFEYENLKFRMDVKLPDVATFRETPTGRRRTLNAAELAREQAIRERWRALLLALKAKLVAVEEGISTVQQEFMAFLVCPDGRTLGSHLVPELEHIVNTGVFPKLLPAPRGNAE